MIAAGAQSSEAPTKKKTKPRIPKTIDSTLSSAEGGASSGVVSMAAFRTPMRAEFRVTIFSGCRGMEVVCKEGSPPTWPPREGMPGSPLADVAPLGAWFWGGAAGWLVSSGSGKAIMELHTGHSTVVP